MLKTLEKTALAFAKNQPYKKAPYASRAWGHKYHSLCSYQGKLKPAIAHFLIEQFSRPGDVVLDPLGGVGTVAYEAALLGRNSITNDISPFAHAVATAKLSHFDFEKIKKRLRKYESDLNEYEPSEDDYKSTEFGLNGKVKDYFHPKTMKEILFFRNRFRSSKLTKEDCWIQANLLHILHGNRPYALSRMSHGVTPMNPKGPFVYKNVIQYIEKRLIQLNKYAPSKDFIEGKSFLGSFEKLPSSISSTVDLIVTSPPFIGMRFDRPNWLRLWFMGWIAEDFHVKSLEFLDRRQTKSFDCYKEFYNVCSKALKKDGLLVIHLGGSIEVSMATKLMEECTSEFKLVHQFEEDVESIETFGISDRGKTKTHEFLFLRRI